MSVLFDELIESLDIRTGKRNIVVDCTLGLAGHTIGILERLHPGDSLIAFDLDLENLTQAKINILNRFEKDIYTLGISAKCELHVQDSASSLTVPPGTIRSGAHLSRKFHHFSENPENQRFSNNVAENQAIFFSGYIQNKNITLHLIHGSFAHLKATLESLDIDSVTAICYDL